MSQILSFPLAKISEAFLAGFQNAQQSLQMLLQKEVQLSAMQYQEFAFKVQDLEEICYLFETQLMGDIKGQSFWLLKQSDFDALCTHLLSAEQAEEKLFRQSLLLELDNILSANVITELANKLQINIHGYVPRVKYHSELQSLEWIQQNALQNREKHLWYISFIVPALNLRLHFIWLLATNNVRENAIS